METKAKRLADVAAEFASGMVKVNDFVKEIIATRDKRIAEILAEPTESSPPESSPPES